MRRGIHQPLGVRVLGGLSLVALLGACNHKDQGAPRATKERSQVVVATAGPEKSAAPAASPPASASAKKAPRKLCAGELDKPGKKLTDKPISRASAPGAKEPQARLAAGAGRWTWINFWAAWCVPCKEEMPRLQSFQKKLSTELALTFVSLDDDARQLDEFLRAQPEGGVRTSYWLKEGKEREEWLGAHDIEADPELPTHLLVDPEGKVRCRVQGAIEDADFAALSAIVGK